MLDNHTILFDAVLLMQEAIAGFLLLVMATYWATEALPLPITALIPIFYLPLTGIMTTEDVTMLYMKVFIANHHTYLCG